MDIVGNEIRSYPQADPPMLYLEIPLGNLGASFFLQGQIRPAKKAIEEVVRAEGAGRASWHPIWRQQPDVLPRVQPTSWRCLRVKSGDFPGSIRHLISHFEVAQEVRRDERSMSENNPTILHLEVLIREARSGFEFAEGKIKSRGTDRPPASDRCRAEEPA